VALSATRDQFEAEVKSPGRISSYPPGWSETIDLHKKNNVESIIMLFFLKIDQKFSKENFVPQGKAGPKGKF